MKRCQWSRYIPADESPRGSDVGLVEHGPDGWRCKHRNRPGSDYCAHHEMQAVRLNMILDWATYQLSRRRDSFAPYSYDWVCRPEIARCPLDGLAAALDGIIQDRARDGAKRANIEVADLVRALHSVNRDRDRDSKGGDCSHCFGTGWFTVYNHDKPGMSGAVPCRCSEGRQRRDAQDERGSSMSTIDNLPYGWSADRCEREPEWMQACPSEPTQIG